MYTSMLRQWHLLRQLPRAPRQVDGDTLQRKMDALGYGLSRRMIHRDLHALAEVFPLLKDERGKPHGWAWMRDAPGMDMPQMDAATALVFNLVEQHLVRLLPPSLMDLLAPSFGQARRTLDALGHGLSGKIRIVSMGPAVVPPAADEGVVGTYTEALLRGRRVRIRYRRAGSEPPSEYLIDPQGLALRGSTLIFVATRVEGGDGGLRHFLAHRCDAAEMLETAAVPLPDFDLGRHAAADGFGFVRDPNPVELVVDFEASVEPSLREAPLSGDQRLERQADGDVRLTATVIDTQALRGWLLGFGAKARVVAPVAMRDAFEEIVAAMGEKYRAAAVSREACGDGVK